MSNYQRLLVPFTPSSLIGMPLWAKKVSPININSHQVTRYSVRYNLGITPYNLPITFPSSPIKMGDLNGSSTLGLREKDLEPCQIWSPPPTSKLSLR
jgi:hypothetical protein